AMNSVADFQKAEVSSKLIELDNRIDRGRRYMQQAKDDSQLSPAQRMLRYQSALSEFEKAREIIKYLPVDTSTSDQESEIKSLSSEAEKAVASLKASAASS